MSIPLARIPSIDLLRGFVAVGRRMSITLAAQDLFLTQSAVSRQIHGLESALGIKLFERAAIHCRNNDVDTLYMHCLSSNATMMHIAKKAGMEIHRDYGEADAYLKLPPANPTSVLQEALDEQFATLDYTLKANKRFASKWLHRLIGRKARQD